MIKFFRHLKHCWDLELSLPNVTWWHVELIRVEKSAYIGCFLYGRLVWIGHKAFDL